VGSVLRLCWLGRGKLAHLGNAELAEHSRRDSVNPVDMQDDLRVPLITEDVAVIARPDVKGQRCGHGPQTLSPLLRD
jgi:hypothetical protein